MRSLFLRTCHVIVTYRLVLPPSASVPISVSTSVCRQHTVSLARLLLQEYPRSGWSRDADCGQRTAVEYLQSLQPLSSAGAAILADLGGAGGDSTAMTRMRSKLPGSVSARSVGASTAASRMRSRSRGRARSSRGDGDGASVNGGW